MSVGFVHEVMKTDNLSLLLITIDYGPSRIVDDYDPHYNPIHSDNVTLWTKWPDVTKWNLKMMVQSLVSMWNLRGITDFSTFIWHFSRYAFNWKQFCCVFSTITIQNCQNPWKEIRTSQSRSKIWFREQSANWRVVIMNEKSGVFYEFLQRFRGNFGSIHLSQKCEHVVQSSQNFSNSSKFIQFNKTPRPRGSLDRLNETI